jgi:uncharacterized membrane protein YfhO
MAAFKRDVEEETKMSDRLSIKQHLGGRLGSRAKICLKSNGCVAIAFFASAILMVFLWFVNSMFPFGERTLLRIDLYHQYAPLFGELYQRLTSGGSLLYSWYSGLGGGFLGNFFNYLASPASLLVLLFGHENIPEAIAFMLLIKCAFASGAFAYMLRKMFGKNDAAAAAFGVLYSFCGWFIAYYWNIMWVDALALLPLVALGVHFCVHKHKFKMYMITLAVTLLANYYMGFIVCVFSLLYFLAEYFSHYQVDAMLSSASKKSLRQSKFLRSAAAFAIGSLIAAAFAAFALIPVYFTLQNSSATGESMLANIQRAFAMKVESNFSIFNFLVNHFADLEPTWRGHGPGAIPNVYSGVCAMVLAPLFLFIPSIKAREKFCYGLLTLFLFLSLNISNLNYIWHAFKFPNDLPHRFSFVYSFTLLLLAYRAFQHLREIPAKALMFVGGLAALFIVITEKVGSDNIQDTTIFITLAFLALYGVIFVTKTKSGKKATRVGISALLLCCVITEVTAATVKNFEITQNKPDFTWGQSHFQQVKADLLKDDPSFYRMELTDSRTLMDPAWLGYRGVSAFSSMANERTANLESRLGLHSNFINSYNYNPNTPIFNAMHNIKYLIENQNLPPEIPHGSSFIETLNPRFYVKRDEFSRERFTVFENKYPLSAAFWADKGIKEWKTTGQSNPFLLQQDFWNKASNINSDVFLPLDVYIDDSVSLEHDISPSVSFNNTISYSNKPNGTEVRMQLLLYANETTNAYIYASADYVSAIHVIREDRPDEMRHPIRSIWDIGEITPDIPLRVEIRLNSNDAPESDSFNFYAYSINTDAFEESYNALAQGMLQVLEYSDTHLKGELIAQHDGVLFTSIPYDEGWNVLVNGRRIPKSRYIALGDGGFLGVPIPAGELEIELKYEPQGLRHGIMISAATLLLFALAHLFHALVRRKKRLEESRFFPENSSPEDNEREDIRSHAEGESDRAHPNLQGIETENATISDES